MKLATPTLRSYLALHTWTGLIAGLALFIAFYAGSLTLFHDEIRIWAEPELRHVDQQTLQRAQQLIDTTIAAYPEVAQGTSYLYLRGAYSTTNAISWQRQKEADGDAHEGEAEYVTADDQHAEPYDGETDTRRSLSDLVNHLHFTLGLPERFGEYLMGVVCLMYALALVSGLLIHLRQLLPDLFALRAGPNLKRLWQDAHNVIGVLSLPFHVLYAYTGTLLTLSLVLLMALDGLAMDGKLRHQLGRIVAFEPHRVASGEAASMLSVSELIVRAQAEVPGMQPAMLFLTHYGDRNAVITVRGPVAGRLLQDSFVSLDGASGAVLGRQSGAERTPYGTAVTTIATLHYATYGGLPLRLLYFGLGLAGTFLFYSGNLLWLERRRRRSADAPAVHRTLARLTVGVCLGCIAAVSACFIAAQCLPMQIAQPGVWLWRVYYAVFALALAWALLRRPGRAAVELLWLCAALTAAIPLANAWHTGEHLLWTALHGMWPVFGIDLGALLLALCWAVLARHAARRIASTEVRSVWS